MIHARSLQRSSHPLKNGHRLSILPFRPYQNFTSSKTIGSAAIQANRAPSIQPRTPSRPLRWPLTRYGGFVGARFASRAADVPPVAEFQPDFPPASPISSSPAEDFQSTQLDDVTSSLPASVYDHIGFLKELGLDYGWGPTASMEWLLEHVHIYAGTPWWASIGITLLLIRACLLKIYFNAADAAARNQLIAQYNAPLMEKVKAAQRNKDSLGLQKALAEMKDLRASAGVKLSRTFMPFIQIPIGFGFFRLMRGMSNLPVPGLDCGGLLWMQDLTISDPYFILPIATAGCYYYSFKAGSSELGSTSMISPDTMKVIIYALPLFSGAIMTVWPGALQLTFFIQALITLVQSTALRQPWFRDMIGIQPLPEPKSTKPNSQVYVGTINRATGTDAASEVAGKGFLGGAQADLKSAYSSFKNKVYDYQQKQSKQTGRRTLGELKHAKAYDERRRRELAQEKFEREQDMAGKMLEEEEKRKERKRKMRH